MKGVGQASAEMAQRYFALFVNRLAYTLQSHKPGANGKHYYYRPKQDRRLSLQTIREHLNGQLTAGLYALNPNTQRSKWVAIDADYENALEDLLKLQWELRQDGVEAALEKSRRGAHLWIFADKPLLARHCRIYIYNLARRLKVPVKGGSGLAEGIEVFPRQDQLGPDEFGNAIRGPLGIHRATERRYWFYGADYRLDAQTGVSGAPAKDHRDRNGRVHSWTRNAGRISSQAKSRAASIRSHAPTVPHSRSRPADVEAWRKLLGTLSIMRGTWTRSRRRQFGHFSFGSAQVQVLGRVHQGDDPRGCGTPDSSQEAG